VKRTRRNLAFQSQIFSPRRLWRHRTDAEKRCLYIFEHRGVIPRHLRPSGQAGAVTESAAL